MSFYLLRLHWTSVLIETEGKEERRRRRRRKEGLSEFFAHGTANNFLSTASVHTGFCSDASSKWPSGLHFKAVICTSSAVSMVVMNQMSLLQNEGRKQNTFLQRLTFVALLQRKCSQVYKTQPPLRARWSFSLQYGALTLHTSKVKCN